MSARSVETLIGQRTIEKQEVALSHLLIAAERARGAFGKPPDASKLLIDAFVTLSKKATYN